MSTLYILVLIVLHHSKSYFFSALYRYLTTVNQSCGSAGSESLRDRLLAMLRDRHGAAGVDAANLDKLLQTPDGLVKLKEWLGGDGVLLESLNTELQVSYCESYDLML